MRIVKIIIFCGFLILVACSNVSAKEWRGLIPMHSTCEDVKRVLGITKCQTSFYDFKDERIYIIFTESSCYSHPPGDWNVPIGTVREITVYPKVRPKLEGLHLDLSKFTVERDPEVTFLLNYWNTEEGFAFVTGPDGTADQFSYFATPKDDYLHCPGYKKPTPLKTAAAPNNSLQRTAS